MCLNITQPKPNCVSCPNLIIIIIIRVKDLFLSFSYSVKLKQINSVRCRYNYIGVEVILHLLSLPLRLMMLLLLLRRCTTIHKHLMIVSCHTFQLRVFTLYYPIIILYSLGGRRLKFFHFLIIN